MHHLPPMKRMVDQRLAAQRASVYDGLARQELLQTFLMQSVTTS